MSFWNALWYHKRYPLLVQMLRPLSWIYTAFFYLHRRIMRCFVKKYPIPVLVVGNMTVGGTGKTPLLIALAQHVQAQGLRVGIVSRGYGSQAAHFPLCVDTGTSVADAGDEPYLIALKTAAPLVIAPRRNEAIAMLLARYTVDIILSDDGLQHHAMGRDLEIVLIDGKRGFGNGYCLPAGPLREPVRRMQSCDFVVVHGHDGEEKFPSSYAMTLLPVAWMHVASHRMLPLDHVQGSVCAVAGIGHPERFFDTLRQLSLSPAMHVFPDHHVFRPQDFVSFTQVLVMTEKDAVKCRAFAQDNWYALVVRPHLPEVFWNRIDRKMQLLLEENSHVH